MFGGTISQQSAIVEKKILIRMMLMIMKFAAQQNH